MFFSLKNDRSNSFIRNYAPGILPQFHAARKGYSQVCLSNEKISQSRLRCCRTYGFLVKIMKLLRLEQ
jgi:hypothetical protein